jgi:hypothetical protein
MQKASRKTPYIGGDLEKPNTVMGFGAPVASGRPHRA